MSRSLRSANSDRTAISAAVNRRRIVSEPADSLHHLLSGEYQDGNLSIADGGGVLFEGDNPFFNPVVENPSTTQLVTMDFMESEDGNEIGTILGLSVHKKAGQFCDMCDKLANKPERLRQHLTLNHGGSIDFDCEHCGKSFGSKNQLTRHLKTHGESDPKQDAVAGSLSPPSAQGSATTTPSKRGHKDHGEKRFQCLQCSKRFPTSKDLKRHDVVHTGNREFQCSFCSHRFGRKDHRMRHEKKTHAAELQRQQQQQQQQQNSPKQLSPPPPLAQIPLSPPSGPAPKLRTRSSETKQRWRHMSSPSTFRHGHPGSPGITGSVGTFLAEINMEEDDEPKPGPENVVVGKDGVIFKQDSGFNDQVIISKASDITIKKEEPAIPDEIAPVVKLESNCESVEMMTRGVQESPPPLTTMHDRSFGVLRVGQQQTAMTEDITMNGDLDTLLSEMMSDSPGAVISGIDQEGMQNFQKPPEMESQGAMATSFPSSSSFGVPANEGYQAFAAKSSPHQMIPATSTKVLMTLDSNPMMTSVAASAPSGFNSPPPKFMSDTFTRTKNPVLPSVYIDNSLIVPEPAKQKYHSPHHSLLFESDFMDIDSFLKVGGAAPGDGKEINESIFDM